jgi:hypothetical protein
MSSAHETLFRQGQPSALRLAQSVKESTTKQKVEGSNPIRSNCFVASDTAFYWQMCILLANASRRIIYPKITHCFRSLPYHWGCTLMRATQYHTSSSTRNIIWLWHTHSSTPRSRSIPSKTQNNTRYKDNVKHLCYKLYQINSCQTNYSKTALLPVFREKPFRCLLRDIT